MKQHNAYVITPSAINEFRPSMQRGDEETRNFAARSNLAMDIGGMSMALSSDVSQDVLKEAIAILSSLIK